MKLAFDEFLNSMSETNATLDYFTDFDKVKNNVAQIEIKLNQLNYLLGKDNLKEAVYDLYVECPNAFSVLEILIAVRQKEQKKTLDKQGQVVLLNSYLQSPDKIIEFLENTGLSDIFRDKNIKNLVDYVFGIEVGLDTNARKNRGGDNMSKAVRLLFDNANIFYKKEVKNTLFKDIESLGTDVKQFDFVIKTNIKTYVIETNYYNSGGSKLNEVAELIPMLHLKSINIRNMNLCGLLTVKVGKPPKINFKKPIFKFLQSIIYPPCQVLLSN